MIFQQKWMGQIKSARASAEGAFSIKPCEWAGSLAMTSALEHLAQKEVNAIEVSKPLKPIWKHRRTKPSNDIYNNKASFQLKIFSVVLLVIAENNITLSNSQVIILSKN